MKLEEEWINIKNYSNYQISSYGNVKSKERNTNVGIKNQKQCLRKEKILKQQIDKNGYHYVRLYNEDGWKYFKIHRLVAEAFIPNPENKPTVDHIDRDKNNNNVNNLRWASLILQANNKDKTNIIKQGMKIGKMKLPNRAKKVKQYSPNGEFIKEYKSSREASKINNISESSISNCIKKHCKTAGGYIWLR